MIIAFEEAYLQELYEQGKCHDRKHRFQPQIIRNYHKCVDILAASPRVETLFTFPALNYEALSGDRKGYASIRINLQYRLIFKVEVISTEPIVTICRITDITNHYQ